MTTCAVQRRADARAAADSLERHPHVDDAVAVLSPEEGHVTRWSLDILVETGTRPTVPADILHQLRDLGFGVRRAVPRGPSHHVVAAVARR